MMGACAARGILVVVAVALIVGCAMRKPIEQRTTQGPTAQQLWAWRMTSQLGREPNFDERRYFDDELELRIARYLSEHPEDANALGVSAFRFDRQVSVGMSREQVAILLGPPVAQTDGQRGDGEAGAEVLARHQAARPRGVDVSARLDRVLRRGGAGGRHHAVLHAREGGRFVIRSRLVVTKETPLAPRGHAVVEREETYAGSFFAKPVAIRVTRRGLEAGLDHLRPAAAAGH